MNWEEFKELKARLMIVCERFSRNISRNATSLKRYPKYFCDLTALVPIFGSITEQHFTDLTYRYILSDKDLSLIGDTLNTLNINE